MSHSHHAEAVRAYGVDRISAVQQTAHEFGPPDGLDPVTALEENLGTGWDSPVLSSTPH